MNPGDAVDDDREPMSVEAATGQPVTVEETRDAGREAAEDEDPEEPGMDDEEEERRQDAQATPQPGAEVEARATDPPDDEREGSVTAAAQGSDRTR